MKLLVNLDKNSYEVIIERGILSHINEQLNISGKALVVSDSGVPKIYLDTVLKQLKNGYLVVIPQGELNKNFDSYLTIMNALVANSFTRTDSVIAVGGGVVGDLAGFAASTYMRGIDFYNIPTTLLSQVDSSIGGKTGLDYKDYKNIIGSFYQPKKVLIDPDTLHTLNNRLISEGLAEAIKMAMCFDEKLFNKIKYSPKLDNDI